MQKDHIKQDLIPVFIQLSSDEQDSVRLLSVDNCVALGSTLNHEEFVQHILPIIKQCVNDKSWRVRYMVANHFCDIASIPNIGSEIIKNELVSSFIKLLKDTEA